MRRTNLLAGGVIAAAALAAYAGSLSGPFVFDDLASIVDNRTIRHFSSAFFPSPNTTMGGRPVVNLTLAVNYALGGLNVWGYHAVNLLIHIVAGLTLFGVVRRTLEKVGTGGPPVRSEPERRAEVTDGRAARPYLPTLLAFASALIWTLHPLQTESVTYLSQRAESLMGLFYLLTLYCFIRWTDGASSFVPRSGTSAFAEASADRTEDKEAGRGVWAWLSVAACLFGMGTKEVMVSAPVIVLLYDRTFVSGTFRDAWRRRKGGYLGLATTWILLGYLVISAHGRGGTVGFDSGLPWSTYALNQFRAIAHYLRLSLWPHPLVADYGLVLGGSLSGLIRDAAVVLVLLLGALWGLFRPMRQAAPAGSTKEEVLAGCARRGFDGRALGFAGAWFFLILAPSSSVVPIATEIMAEHRMYLPLAAVVVAAVCGIYFLIERMLRRVGTGGPPVRCGAKGCTEGTDGRAARPYLMLCLILAAGFGGMTYLRNKVYQSGQAFWADVVVKAPGNAGAHNNLANLLTAQGAVAEGIAEYREALRLAPDYAEAYNNLGNALVKDRRLPEAAGSFAAAAEIDPNYAAAHNSLGVTLARLGRLEDAITQFAAATRLQPDNAAFHNNFGIALEHAGRTEEADAQFAAATRLRLRP